MPWEPESYGKQSNGSSANGQAGALAGRQTSLHPSRSPASWALVWS